MAYEKPVMSITLEAGEDLSAKQYYFVEINTSTGKAEVCDAATDLPIGVLQNSPASGELAEILVLGISKVSADADLGIGDLIGPSADGQADAKVVSTDSTEYVVGRCISDPSGAGSLATCLINCLNPHRAA